MKKPLIPFRVIRTSTLDKLNERRKSDNKVISDLMAINHSLSQFIKTLPPKYKKGLTAKVKNGKS